MKGGRCLERFSMFWAPTHLLFFSFPLPPHSHLQSIPPPGSSLSSLLLSSLLCFSPCLYSPSLLSSTYLSNTSPLHLSPQQTQEAENNLTHTLPNTQEPK